MNKLNLVTLLIVGAASTSVLAAGSNNTIRFQGEVADQTCSVTVNGNATHPVILLTTAKTSDLATAGAVAEETAFTISVSGCTASTTNAVNIGTTFVANNLTATNNIGNTETDNGVSFQLIDPSKSTGTEVLDVTGATSNPGLVLAVNAQSASYDYAVRYYAEKKATPGKVSGSVQYAISYN